MIAAEISNNEIKNIDQLCIGAVLYRIQDKSYYVLKEVQIVKEDYTRRLIKYFHFFGFRVHQQVIPQMFIYKDVPSPLGEENKKQKEKYNEKKV